MSINMMPVFPRNKNGVHLAVPTALKYVWDTVKNKRMDYVLSDLQSCVGLSYDPTKTYAIGDYCIQNDKLYKCNTAITGAEAWNVTKWTLKNLASELKILNDLTTLVIGTISYGTNINTNPAQLTQLYKVGKVVTLNLSLTWTVMPVSNATAFTIPVAFAPPLTKVLYLNRGDDMNLQVNLDPAGIAIFPYGTSIGGTHVVSASWLVN